MFILGTQGSAWAWGASLTWHRRGAHGAAEGPGRRADQPLLAGFPRLAENSLTEEQPA